MVLVAIIGFVSSGHPRLGIHYLGEFLAIMDIPWGGIQSGDELTIRVHAGMGFVAEERFLLTLIAMAGIFIW